MTIKVLPLDSWMIHEWTREETLELGKYESIEPVFNRAGRYYSRGLCWFELQDGRAFKDDGKQFLYELSLMHALRLTEKQARALESIVKENLANRQQVKQLRLYKEAMLCRKTYRDSLKTMLRIRDY